MITRSDITILMQQVDVTKAYDQPTAAAVDIRAAIEGTPAATKGLVNFASYDTYGIFTCIHEDTDAPTAFAQFRPSLWNVQASAIWDTVTPFSAASCSQRLSRSKLSGTA